MGAEDEVHVATPLLCNTAVQNTDPRAEKETDPVGVPTPSPTTVAEYVTVVPDIMSLGVTVATVVVSVSAGAAVADEPTPIIDPRQTSAPKANTRQMRVDFTTYLPYNQTSGATTPLSCARSDPVSALSRILLFLSQWTKMPAE